MNDFDDLRRKAVDRLEINRFIRGSRGERLTGHLEDNPLRRRTSGHLELRPDNDLSEVGHSG